VLGIVSVLAKNSWGSGHGGGDGGSCGGAGSLWRCNGCCSGGNGGGGGRGKGDEEVGVKNSACVVGGEGVAGAMLLAAAFDSALANHVRARTV